MDFGCPECGGKVAPGRWMCHDCETRYLRLLRDVRPTVQALTSLAMKTSHVGPRDHGGGDGFAPLPINWTMADHRNELVGWLQDTAMHLKPSYGCIPSRQWKLIWTKLVANRTTLLQLPSAVSDYHSLRHTMTLIDRATHPGEDMMLAGQCARCRMPVMCPKTAKTAKCAYCDAENDVETLHKAMNSRIGSLHVTTTPTGASGWIKNEYGITVKRTTIAMRIKRGQLHATPLGDGYYEFPIRELAALADEYHKTEALAY